MNLFFPRARKQIELVSSVTADDILAEGKSRGVVAMRDYLSYSRTGSIPDRIEGHGELFASVFEEAVGGLIARMGYEVVPQVGVAGYRIDLGVRRPGGDGFILGVECDGAFYHSAKSARDRDRLRQEIIEARGWRIHRVWSTDWFRNQNAEEQRLKAAIEAAL